MTSAKRQAYLETAADLIQKVHTDLLHNKQFSRAKQLQEIMRRLVVFSSRKERPNGITFSELSQITKDEGAIPPIIQIKEPELEDGNEKRLIDAKPLMQSGWHLVRTGESNKFLTSMSLADVPTVDAAEVVRCKDCKHYMTIHCTCDGCCIADDWYCADGERKDNA